MEPRKNDDLTVIIPAYNEAEAIGSVVTGLRDVAKDAHVLVVDDGSTDDTGAIAEAAGARVVRHSSNRGYGTSVATGIRNATTSVVALMDADGQHDPADIPRLLENGVGLMICEPTEAPKGVCPLALR